VSDISRKVAIVTGAGRGIGRGISIAYGRAGAKVVAASRTAETVDSLVAEITNEGGTAIAVQCDVGDRNQVFRLIDRAVEAFGAVDILVNNAQSFSLSGNADGHQPIETFDEQEWELIYRTGVLSTLWAMKAAFPFLKNRGGKIINLGSMSGQAGLAYYAAYNATKEGIRALSRTAAREWGKYNINVNVIVPAVRSDAFDRLERDNPAYIAQMLAAIPLGRWGDAVKDAGGLAIFLGSNASDYITGMTFMLNGGQFMYP
jgi:NAD(P)-dependent dehydrogenase (short-subunit alcohol dehydrogenase family)